MRRRRERAAGREDIIREKNRAAGNKLRAAGFYTEDNRYTNLFISNYLDVCVKDALKRVKGVGDVLIFGERKYSMRLWLDPRGARLLLMTTAMSPAPAREDSS